jgi:hypothetical protein
VVGNVDRVVAAVLALPTRLVPQLIKAGPVLVVPVDAKEPKPELRADRLDGGEVTLGVGTHPEAEIAQLAGDVHVTALSERSKNADSPVAVPLEVADQTDDHGA